MGDLDSAINVRCSRAFRDRVDSTAAAVGLTRSEWVMQTLSAALDQTPRGRVVLHDRRGPVHPARCTHPIEVRSGRALDGSSRCMQCGTTFEPI